MRLTVTRPGGGAASAAAAFCLLALALLGPAGARAQWTTDQNNHLTTTTDKVGVGTSSPSARLDVDQPPGTNGVNMFVMTSRGNSNTDVGQFLMRHTNPSATILNTAVVRWETTTGSDGKLTFFTAEDGTSLLTRRLVIDGFGRVGIGTDSPEGLFHVSGGAGIGSLRLSGDRAVMGFLDAGAPANQRQYQWRSERGLFRMSLVNDTDGGNVWQNILVANSAGNVGVGNDSPQEKLEVTGNIGLTGSSEVARDIHLTSNTGGLRFYSAGSLTASPGGAAIQFYGNGSGLPGQAYIDSGAHNEAAIIFRTAPTAGTIAERMRIGSGGNVGIGTATPGAKLEVNAGSNDAVAIKATGGIDATGTITGDNIVARFQDVAEWVPSTQKLSAGTVVVLDAARTNHVLASFSAYDTKVAGVVSEQPGVILGVGGEGKVKVATTGRVKVRVDATRGSIKVGDLLVTSGVEGVAMKSVPVDLGGTPIHRPGTIIGKALEPLASGTGEILVLLSLQ